jgi:hypothetical protein
MGVGGGWPEGRPQARARAAWEGLPAHLYMGASREAVHRHLVHRVPGRGAPAPVVDYETKRPKIDQASGEPLYAVQVIAMQDGESDIITVKVPGLPPTLPQGTPVRVVDLVANPWSNNGKSGVAFRAVRIESAQGKGS